MAEWSTRRTRNHADLGSSPPLATCLICSRSSQVHILGRARKKPNGFPPASWGFYFYQYVLCVLLASSLNGVPVN